MIDQPLHGTTLTRRTLISAANAGGAALAACGRPIDGPQAADAIAAAETARPHTGRTRSAALSPGPADLDLGGTIARSLAYNGSLPGPLIRANVGDELATTVTNGLDHPSSVHWHGIALRNDMDGAAPATPNIAPGAAFTYRFSSPHPGTYWPIPIPASTPTTGCTCRSSSTIPARRAATTPSVS